MARFGLPINGLDDFEAEVLPGRWNGHPVPLVPHDYATQIAEAVGDPKPEPYVGLRPYDGLCWQILCRECGGPMVLESGQIGDLCADQYGGTYRVWRLGKFWDCVRGCGWCEEAR